MKEQNDIALADRCLRASQGEFPVEACQNLLAIASQRLRHLADLVPVIEVQPLEWDADEGFPIWRSRGLGYVVQVLNIPSGSVELRFKGDKLGDLLADVEAAKVAAYYHHRDRILDMIGLSFRAVPRPGQAPAGQSRQSH